MAMALEIEVKADALKRKLSQRPGVDKALADTTMSLEEKQAAIAKLDADLHSECDYILKNFATRQDARAAEIASLQEAKAILSGA